MHIGVLSVPSNFHCRKWAGALAQAGAQVSVFSFERGEIPGVEVVQLPAPVRWAGRYRYPNYFFKARALHRALLRHGVTLLHPLHLTPFGSWGHWSGFRPTLPAAMGADVFDFRPGAHGVTWGGHRGPIHRRFFRARVREVLRSACHLTADNRALVDALVDGFQVPREKITLLRWGLDPETLLVTPAEIHALCSRLQLPVGARVLLSPRGLLPVYQPEIVLPALLAVAESFGPNEFAVVLGAGYGVPDNLRPIVEKIRAHPKIRLVEAQLNRADVAALWALTDVFLSAPAYDGYSAAVAEGRYVGAVPVVNAIPGNLEVIAHGANGIVVEPFTPAHLVAALRHTWAQRQRLKARFAPLNRTWVEAHSLLRPAAERFLALAERFI